MVRFAGPKSLVTESLRHKSFAVRYLTLFGGETFSKVCVMAAFAYLAHVLPASDYGTIEWALSVTVFFVLGVESGMGLYGARVVAAAPERIPQLVPQIMLLRVVLGVPAFALILAVSAYYRVAGLGILAVNGIAVLLTPFLTQWVFQGLRQMQWVAAGSAIRNFTFVALVLLLVRPGADVRLVALSEVSGVAALALFNTLVLHRWLRIRLDWNELFAGTRRVFRDVWFMGFSDFAWACLWYSPALIIRWLGLGMEEVAWVAASVRMVLALHTFVWLYFFNMLPNLARELAVGFDAWCGLMVQVPGNVDVAGVSLRPRRHVDRAGSHASRVRRRVYRGGSAVPDCHLDDSGRVVQRAFPLQSDCRRAPAVGICRVSGGAPS